MAESSQWQQDSWDWNAFSLAGHRRGEATSNPHAIGGDGLLCQVPDCGRQLDANKRCHVRYRLCEVHLRAPQLMVNGVPSRFCQQCGRFQPVEEFDSNKKSCRAQLEKHNARRRKAGQADPPPKRSRALSIVVVEAPPSGSPQEADAESPCPTGSGGTKRIALSAGGGTTNTGSQPSTTNTGSQPPPGNGSGNLLHADTPSGDGPVQPISSLRDGQTVLNNQLQQGASPLLHTASGVRAGLQAPPACNNYASSFTPNHTHAPQQPILQPQVLTEKLTWLQQQQWQQQQQQLGESGSLDRMPLNTPFMNSMPGSGRAPSAQLPGIDCLGGCAPKQQLQAQQAVGVCTVSPCVGFNNNTPADANGLVQGIGSACASPAPNARAMPANRHDGLQAEALQWAATACDGDGNRLWRLAYGPLASQPPKARQIKMGLQERLHEMQIRLQCLQQLQDCQLASSSSGGQEALSMDAPPTLEDAQPTLAQGKPTLALLQEIEGQPSCAAGLGMFNVAGGLLTPAGFTHTPPQMQEVRCLGNTYNSQPGSLTLANNTQYGPELLCQGGHLTKQCLAYDSGVGGMIPCGGPQTADSIMTTGGARRCRGSDCGQATGTAMQDQVSGDDNSLHVGGVDTKYAAIQLLGLSAPTSLDADCISRPPQVPDSAPAFFMQALPPASDRGTAAHHHPRVEVEGASDFAGDCEALQDGLARLSIKIGGCTPDELPYPLRSRLESWLGMADSVLLHGFIRPGCTHLILDVEVPVHLSFYACLAHGSHGQPDSVGHTRGALGAEGDDAAWDLGAPADILARRLLPDAMPELDEPGNTKIEAGCGRGVVLDDGSSTHAMQQQAAQQQQQQRPPSLVQALTSVLGPSLVSHDICLQCGPSEVRLSNGRVRGQRSAHPHPHPVAATTEAADAQAVPGLNDEANNEPESEAQMEISALSVAAIVCGSGPTAVRVAGSGPGGTCQEGAVRFHLRALGVDHPCEASPATPGCAGVAGVAGGAMQWWDVYLPSIDQACLAVLEATDGKRLSNWLPLVALDDPQAAAEMNGLLGPVEGTGTAGAAVCGGAPCKHVQPMLVTMGRILDTCTLAANMAAAAFTVPHITLPPHSLDPTEDSEAPGHGCEGLQSSDDEEDEEHDGSDGGSSGTLTRSPSLKLPRHVPTPDHPLFSDTRKARLRVLAHRLVAALTDHGLLRSANTVRSCLLSGNLGSTGAAANHDHDEPGGEVQVGCSTAAGGATVAVAPASAPRTQHCTDSGQGDPVGPTPAPTTGGSDSVAQLMHKLARFNLPRLQPQSSLSHSKRADLHQPKLGACSGRLPIGASLPNSSTKTLLTAAAMKLGPEAAAAAATEAVRTTAAAEATPTAAAAEAAPTAAAAEAAPTAAAAEAAPTAAAAEAAPTAAAAEAAPTVEASTSPSSEAAATRQAGAACATEAVVMHDTPPADPLDVVLVSTQSSSDPCPTSESPTVVHDGSGSSNNDAHASCPSSNTESLSVLAVGDDEGPLSCSTTRPNSGASKD